MLLWRRQDESSGGSLERSGCWVPGEVVERVTRPKATMKDRIQPVRWAQGPPPMHTGDGVQTSVQRTSTLQSKSPDW